MGYIMDIVHLVRITHKNIGDIIELDAGDGEYIPKNSYTIIDALLANNLHSLRGIYLGKIPIGLVYIYPEKNEVIIPRFMIDKKYQGKGYGFKAMTLILKYIKRTYEQDYVIISSSNPIALKLYIKAGFVDEDNKRTKNYYKKYKEHLLRLKL